MQSTYFISDTHFYHSNVIKYSSRPFSSAEEMNEQMIQNWNAMVKPGDNVYHLGDVSFGPYKETKTLLNRLNGDIHVILGNHDKIIYKNINDLQSSLTLASVQNYKELKLGDPYPMIVLFHYGQRVWNKSHYGSIHCYGHSHGNLPPHGKSVDVGVDSIEITRANGENGGKSKFDYRPIHLDELLEYMSKRNFEAVDHHIMES